MEWISGRSDVGWEHHLFRQDVIINAWPCTRYRKYHEGITIVPEEQSSEGAIVIPEG